MLMPSIFNENLFDTFDHWMDFPFTEQDYGKQARNLMKTDVKETDGGYEVSIDLPGFKKEDLHLELNDGYLTISAEKNENRDEKDDRGRYIRRERYSGSMSRSFFVGKDLTEQDIHAKYEDGILTLGLPKEEKQEVPQKHYIAIEG